MAIVCSSRNLRVPPPEEGESELEGALRQHDLHELHSPDWLERLDYRIRLATVERQIRASMPRGALVADVGCAQANQALLLTGDGYRVLACDLRVGFLRYAARKSAAGGPWLAAASGTELPLVDGAADVVVLGEILEHVAHPNEFLTEARRVLHPGGLVIATTPNGGYRRSPLPTWNEARGHLEDYEARQFGPDGGDHLFLYTAEELDELLTEAGFAEVHATHYFAELTARVAGKSQTMRSWKKVSAILSPSVAFALALADRAILSGSRRGELASALIVTGRRT